MTSKTRNSTYPVIDEKRERRLCQIIQGEIEGNKRTAVDELMNIGARLVPIIASKHSKPRTYRFDSLVCVGYEILWKIAKKYDYRRGSYLTFVNCVLDRELRHHAHHDPDSVPGIHIPVTALERFTQTRKRTSSILNRSNTPLPSYHDCSALKRDIDYIKKIEDLIASRSLDNPQERPDCTDCKDNLLSEEQEDYQDSFDLGTSDGIEEFIKRHDLKIFLEWFRSIREISPQERRVLELYYLHDLTLKQIGEKLHLSGTRIWQIRTSAVKRLRGIPNKDKKFKETFLMI